MSSGDCAQTRIALGVYLLCAIEPHERARLTDHLASCLACREKLAVLAGLPALLRKVPADEAIRGWIDDNTDQPPPGPPLETLLAELARTRRRRRRWAIAAAAALAIGLAVAGLQAFHPSAPAPAAAAGTRWTITVTGASPATGVWAAIRYAAMPWGSKLEVRVTGVPAGTLCQLRVTGAQGQGITAADWTIASGGRPEWIPASVRLRADTLLGFEVTTGDRVLVSIPAPWPPADGVAAALDGRWSWTGPFDSRVARTSGLRPGLHLLPLDKRGASGARSLGCLRRLTRFAAA